MTRGQYRQFLILRETPRAAAGNVVQLRRAGVRLVAPLAAVESAPPRETSWRDLVRRLAKNLAKR